MATGGGFRGTSPPLVVSGSARAVLGESVTERSEVPSPLPLWANVPADILGSLLRLLPCVADRASVRSVCRHWRDAARVQTLPAPLPVLVFPRFIRFSCLTSDGALTVARRAQMPVVAAGNDLRQIAGCSDDWVMAVKQTGEPFLVKAFSSEVVHLPCLRSNSKYNYICLDEFARIRGLYQSGACLYRSALSASPSSGSKYIVAALIYRWGGTDPTHPGLAIWQPGMTSWYLCVSSQINRWIHDLAFYQGKLYMVRMDRPDIFAFELREDEHGVSLSCPKHYKINPLIPSKTTGLRLCNLVVWREKLLLIIRFFCHSILDIMERNLCNVEVFTLDFSTSLCGVSQIHDFDGDCIFVQSYGCRSFSPDLHAGVQGDLIYFSENKCIDNHFIISLYNMRDSTVRRCAAGPQDGCIGLPVWIFPSF